MTTQDRDRLAAITTVLYNEGLIDDGNGAAYIEEVARLLLIAAGVLPPAEPGAPTIGGIVHNHRYADNPRCGERMVGECIAPGDRYPASVPEAAPGLREAAEAVAALWDDDDINPADGAWQAANDAFLALRAALDATPPPALDVERLAKTLRYHPTLRGKQGDWVDGWDEATTTVLALLAATPPTDETP